MKLEDIKLQLGDKMTCKHKLEKDIFEQYVNQGLLNNEYWFDEEYAEILKIERWVHPAEWIYTDGYRLETIWERKELLTDREKDILRMFLETANGNRNKIKKIDLGYDVIMLILDGDSSHCIKGTFFKGMEFDKEYSIEELGL